MQKLRIANSPVLPDQVVWRASLTRTRLRVRLARETTDQGGELLYELLYDFQKLMDIRFSDKKCIQ